MISYFAAEKLKAVADHNGWVLDLWPATGFEPTGEARLRIGRAELTVKGGGFDAERLAESMLDALAAIGEAPSV